MQDIIYPFTRKQNKALIYSWGLCLPKGVEHHLGYKELCLLAKHLNLSPNTLVARFEEGPSDPYLTFSRDGSHYIVRRSEVPHGYLGISFDPSWRKDLTTLETILIAAIACRSLLNKPPLTYGQIAARTGYSRRQVIRHVGILADKGYLVPCVVEEEVRVTTKKGTSQKQRERDSHTLSPSFYQSWLQAMLIKAEKDKILIYAQNPFKEGYLEKKFYTDKRIEIITNTTHYSSPRFLHETSLMGQSAYQESARHKGLLLPPSHEAKNDKRQAVPSFFMEGEGGLPSINRNANPNRHKNKRKEEA